MTIQQLILPILFPILSALAPGVSPPERALAGDTPALESSMQVDHHQVQLEADAAACDWSECRDTCYDARRSCFAFGNETEVCEANYDECTDWCDRNC